MLTLLCGVPSLFYIVPLQESNQARRACDGIPAAAAPSSCISQVCHTRCRLQLTSFALFAHGLHHHPAGFRRHRVYQESANLGKDGIVALYELNRFRGETNSSEVLSLDASELV